MLLNVFIKSVDNLAAMGANIERIGTEKNTDIIADLLDEGYIVVTLDYLGAPEAKGKKLDFSHVYIKEAFANLGPSGHLRRVQPGPQGRAMPYKKSMCHLTVIVTDEKKGGR